MKLKYFEYWIKSQNIFLGITLNEEFEASNEL